MLTPSSTSTQMNRIKPPKCWSSIALVITVATVLAITTDTVDGAVGNDFKPGTLSHIGLTAAYLPTGPVKMPNIMENQQDFLQTENVQRKQTPLIVNGENAWISEFPYQALIMVEYGDGLSMICGGALISPRHVLTAAHCLLYLTGEEGYTLHHYVAVGFNNISDAIHGGEAQYHNVSAYKKHKGSMDLNDIAVLTVDGDFFESPTVGFANLATHEMGDWAREECLLSGWGIAYNDGSFKDILQWGDQYITPEQECRDHWAFASWAKITNRHICGHNYPVGPCHGDSGSPLSCGKYVVGVLSWGLSDCSGCSPEVYTRVSYFYDWILAVMSGELRSTGV